MRSKILLTATIIALLAAFTGACGGAAGDPAETVEEAYTAVLDGDAATACDLVTAEGLTALLTSDSTGDCEAEVEDFASTVEMLEIEFVGAETVEENGDTATVEVTVEAFEEQATSELSLVDDGGWKIAGEVE